MIVRISISCTLFIVHNWLQYAFQPQIANDERCGTQCDTDTNGRKHFVYRICDYKSTGSGRQPIT